MGSALTLSSRLASCFFFPGGVCPNLSSCTLYLHRSWRGGMFPLMGAIAGPGYEIIRRITTTLPYVGGEIGWCTTFFLVTVIFCCARVLCLYSRIESRSSHSTHASPTECTESPPLLSVCCVHSMSLFPSQDPSPWMDRTLRRCQTIQRRSNVLLNSPA